MSLRCSRLRIPVSFFCKKEGAASGINGLTVDLRERDAVLFPCPGRCNLVVRHTASRGRRNPRHFLRASCPGGPMGVCEGFDKVFVR